MRGLDVNVSAFRGVVISAVASDAGHTFWLMSDLEVVVLIGLVLASTSDLLWPLSEFLVAIRYGFSAVCLRKLLRLGIRAPGVPVGLLVNLIAGLDVHVGASALLYGIEARGWAAADVTRVDAVSAITCAIAAGRASLSAIVSEGT